MAGALNVASVQPGQIITTGLQLWLEPDLYSSYPGSGTSCYDLSTNHYTATLQRSVGFDTGRAPSFTFDGAAGRKYINVGQYISSNTFTLSSWFKSSSTATYQMLFSKEQTGGQPWNYRLWLELTTGKIRGDTANGVSSENLVTSANYCDGTWHNAVFVRDVAGGNLYLYADGAQVATAAVTLGSVTNNQNVWIGLSAYTGESAVGSYPMNGNIGQSLIYNVALSATQVKQNFNAMRGKYGV